MGSSKTDIAVSYDVSNDFFRLWLDESMSYTCGIFDDSVLRAEWDKDAANNAQSLVDEFADYLKQHQNQIEALSIFFSPWGFPTTGNKPPPDFPTPKAACT